MDPVTAAPLPPPPPTASSNSVSEDVALSVMAQPPHAPRAGPADTWADGPM
jgi:hypothetical protein